MSGARSIGATTLAVRLSAGIVTNATIGGSAINEIDVNNKCLSSTQVLGYLAIRESNYENFL